MCAYVCVVENHHLTRLPTRFLSHLCNIDYMSRQRTTMFTHYYTTCQTLPSTDRSTKRATKAIRSNIPPINRSPSLSTEKCQHRRRHARLSVTSQRNQRAFVPSPPPHPRPAHTSSGEMPSSVRRASKPAAFEAPGGNTSIISGIPLVSSAGLYLRCSSRSSLKASTAVLVETAKQRNPSGLLHLFKGV